MPPYSVYIHIPFCHRRCGYCDFNTYAGLEELIPQYVHALCQEIEAVHSRSSSRLNVHTIFFGGGTPSLLAAKQLEAILKKLDRCFDLLPDVEITLEANPGTLSSTYLKDIFTLGINRLSLGMQTAQPFELKLLDRQHTTFDVINSVRWARKAGFENLSLDLIFGLPSQILESWETSLNLALGMHPEHISLYCLTVEPGTPFERWVRRGLIPQPDPDQAAEMYEKASELLEVKGFKQYEISNWARANNSLAIEEDILACRHNLQYWENLPYLGLGAGAHGYANGLRTENVRFPRTYIQRLYPLPKDRLSDLPEMQKNLKFPMTYATHHATSVGKDTEMGETMMLGLRLTQQGISRQIFKQRFNQELTDAFGRQIEVLVRKKLLEWTGEDRERIRLTPRGRLLGNQVFVEFI